MTRREREQVVDNLVIAMKARRAARKATFPLAYSAWRHVSYYESLLTDDEFAAYQRWASDTDPLRLEQGWTP